MPTDAEIQDGQIAALQVRDARIKDLCGALLAACNYIENATPNLGRKAADNYRRAAVTYRSIAAGEMRFSSIRD